mgnify:CR=1 FL=1
MVLFTKTGCGSCEYIKNNFDLGRLGVEVKVLGQDAYEALADLAWYGLVEEAQKSLPILVREDETSVLGSEAVRDYLIAKSFCV